MRKFIGLFASTSLVAVQLLAAVPGAAAPGDRSVPQRYASQGAHSKPSAKPGKPSYQKPTKHPSKPSYPKPAARPEKPVYSKPAGHPSKPSYPKPSAQTRPSQGGKYPGQFNRPGNDRPGSPSSNRPNSNKPNISKPNIGKPNRPGGNNNNVNINHNTNININNRYPVYRPAGGGYYRPPNGGYYGPPRAPYGGWHGGYYPPSRYYYNDGPSIGGVLFGVAVTTSLLALLSAASQPDIVYVQGQTPPPLPIYVPPSNASGVPATINVDINAMASSARPSASVCLTEAARQIGATGGNEIRVDRIIDVEQGNGGYRFRLSLLADYPDETRTIPMYCRATSDKIVELTFG